MDAFFITLLFQIFGFKMKRNELVSFEDNQLTKRSYKNGRPWSESLKMTIKKGRFFSSFLYELVFLQMIFYRL